MYRGVGRVIVCIGERVCIGCVIGSVIGCVIGVIWCTIYHTIPYYTTLYTYLTRCAGEVKTSLIDFEASCAPDKERGIGV